jgi:hypothetical protein
MARKRKLRPGKGAKALIFTRFIKPNQPLPDNNRDHRSNVVLVERVKDAKAKDIYKFRYELDAEEGGGDLQTNTKLIVPPSPIVLVTVGLWVLRKLWMLRLVPCTVNAINCKIPQSYSIFIPYELFVARNATIFFPH